MADVWNEADRYNYQCPTGHKIISCVDVSEKCIIFTLKTLDADYIEGSFVINIPDETTFKGE